MSDINLSIIIPHFNIPDLLCRLLRSIPERDDIEVIIVDDCSTESLDSVRQFVSTRDNVSLIVLDQNHGAGRCRNIALERVKGRWILFADADDRFLDGFYDVISAFFDSDNDMVVFTATGEEIDTNNAGTRHFLLNETVDRWCDNKDDPKAALNVRYKLNAPWCKLIRTDMVKENGVAFEEVKVSNDEMFSTRAGYYAKTVEVCKTPIYCITSRPGSLIQVISEENFMTRLQVFVRKYHFLKEHLSTDDFRMLDLSAQEKVFSMIQNRYSLGFCARVVRELRKNRIPFFTWETLRPSTLVSKLKLARNLKAERRRSKKYISKG